MEKYYNTWKLKLNKVDDLANLLSSNEVFVKLLMGNILRIIAHPDTVKKINKKIGSFSDNGILKAAIIYYLEPWEEAEKDVVYLTQFNDDFRIKLEKAAEHHGIRKEELMKEQWYIDFVRCTKILDAELEKTDKEMPEEFNRNYPLILKPKHYDIIPHILKFIITQDDLNLENRPVFWHEDLLSRVKIVPTDKPTFIDTDDLADPSKALDILAELNNNDNEYYHPFLVASLLVDKEEKYIGSEVGMSDPTLFPKAVRMIMEQFDSQFIKDVASAMLEAAELLGEQNTYINPALIEPELSTKHMSMAGVEGTIRKMLSNPSMVLFITLDSLEAFPLMIMPKTPHAIALFLATVAHSIGTHTNIPDFESHVRTTLTDLVLKKELGITPDED